MKKSVYRPTVNKSEFEYFDNYCWNSHYFTLKQMVWAEWILPMTL